MLTPQAAIFLPLSLMLLTACSKGSFDPKLASNFCTHVQLGSDYEQVVTTLESNGLEVRARAEEASKEIGKGSAIHIPLMATSLPQETSPDQPQRQGA